MKLSLILLSHLALVLATGPNDFCTGSFLRRAVAKCAMKHQARQSDIEDYIHLRWANNHNAKCFRACIFEECKAFKADGSLVDNVPQTTGFMTSRRDPSVWKVAEMAAMECMKKQPIGGNKCDIVEAFMRCFPTMSPVKLSLIGAYCENLIEPNMICKINVSNH
ncbi:uncharacterized protein LOC142230647 [Haematobia irritans]|uniref:uncharacterized protein LOC142230647 n=1 Tax=Haematobia irritans TaxID=7368 RepID=UPI003F5073FD